MNAEQLIKLIQQDALAYELRTTVPPTELYLSTEACLILREFCCRCMCRLPVSGPAEWEFNGMRVYRVIGAEPTHFRVAGEHT